MKKITGIKLGFLTIGILGGLLGGMSLFAATPGPCEQIKQTCEGAGFVKGDAKQGFGLWLDCIDPIMQGGPQPKNATKSLPSIDSSVVSACKAKRPHFGQPKAH